MALVIHYLCSSSVPLARAVRSRALTMNSSSSLPMVKTADSHVLLGMSELDLQQLALNFGQVFMFFLTTQAYTPYKLVSILINLGVSESNPGVPGQRRISLSPPLGLSNRAPF